MENAKLETRLVQKWLLDSGESRHMTNKLSLLTEIRTVLNVIDTGEGTKVDVQFVGTMTSEVTVYRRKHNI